MTVSFGAQHSHREKLFLFRAPEDISHSIANTLLFFFCSSFFIPPAENSPQHDLTIAAFLNAHFIEAADSASTLPKVAFPGKYYKSESLILIRAVDLGAGAGKA